MRRWWLLSTGVSFVLLGMIVFHIADEVRGPVFEGRVVDATETDRVLKPLRERERESGRDPLPEIPTGLFLQSFRFENSSEVNVTGYLWQRYPPGTPDDYRGFVFPEAVDSGGNISPAVAYPSHEVSKALGAEPSAETDAQGPELMGWYFESTLRQKFDYTRYPFDAKRIWVRIWHKDFEATAVCTPDFTAYDSVEDRKRIHREGWDDGEALPAHVFGLDPRIVTGGWVVTDTFFSYRHSGYHTTFGFPAGRYAAKDGFPELYFNVVVQRRFWNAFVVNVVPLLVVAVLLFATLLTLTHEQNLSGVLGFNTAGVLGTCSALFFVVAVAHAALREQFAGSGIVYMETFYLAMYPMLLIVGFVSYVFAADTERRWKLVHAHDAAVFKLLFWPLLLGLIELSSALLLGY